MYEPKPIKTDDVVLPEDIVRLGEKLAENTHEVWAKGRVDDGWTFGEQRDDTNKIHPCLRPYGDLPESEKDYDRRTSMETLKVIYKLGYQIIPARSYSDFILFFDYDKLVQGTAYMLGKENAMPMQRLQHLMYLAEREMITKYGLLFTGCDIRRGKTPFLLQLRNCLLGDDSQNDVWEQYFLYDPVSGKVMLRKSPGIDGLSEGDTEVMDKVYNDNKHTDLDHVLKYYPEMRNAEEEGNIISFEDIVNVIPDEEKVVQFLQLHQDSVSARTELMMLGLLNKAR